MGFCFLFMATVVVMAALGDVIAPYDPTAQDLATGETHVLGVPLQVPVLHADGSHVLCHLLIEKTPATTGRPVYIAWIEPVQVG